jgi:hypothetical protein
VPGDTTLLQAKGVPRVSLAQPALQTLLLVLQTLSTAFPVRLAITVLLGRLPAACAPPARIQRLQTQFPASLALPGRSRQLLAPPVVRGAVPDTCRR